MWKKKDIDPVCGMLVKVSEAKFTSVYQDKTYYFCEQDCKERFDQDPTRYLKAFDGRERT
jgi:Cu+-exporting ATPase